MCNIQESGITEKASRETGALTFFPEGRTYSPPTALQSNACRLVYCLRQSCALRGYVSAQRANIFYNRYTRKEVIAYRHIPS